MLKISLVYGSLYSVIGLDSVSGVTRDLPFLVREVFTAEQTTDSYMVSMMLVMVASFAL